MIECGEPPWKEVSILRPPDVTDDIEDDFSEDFRGVSVCRVGIATGAAVCIVAEVKGVAILTFTPASWPADALGVGIEPSNGRSFKFCRLMELVVGLVVLYSFD